MVLQRAIQNEDSIWIKGGVFSPTGNRLTGLVETLRPKDTQLSAIAATWKMEKKEVAEKLAS